MFGLSKGAVIFVRLDNLEYIYARFAVHRQEIRQLTEIRSQNRMISMCAEFKLAIWGFDRTRMKLVCPMYQVYRPFEQFRLINNFIYGVFESGESCYFVLQDDRLRRIDYERGNEHEDKIVSMDVHMARHLLVTADADGLVKVWNAQKDLMREIKFSEPISTVCFMNREADLLVGHGGQLSKISFKDYNPGCRQMFCSAEEIESLVSSSTLIDSDFFWLIKERGFDAPDLMSSK